MEKLLNVGNYLKLLCKCWRYTVQCKSCNEYDYLNKYLEFIKNHDDLLSAD